MNCYRDMRLAFFHCGHADIYTQSYLKTMILMMDDTYHLDTPDGSCHSALDSSYDVGPDYVGFRVRTDFGKVSHSLT